MTSPTPLILPLDSDQAMLANAGGKGLNLTRLARLAFPVPGGFLITTAAYHAFVVANDLQPWLLEQLQQAPAADPAGLEALSTTIRRRFQEATVPAILEGQIRAAYRPLQNRPVAVRSTATAEDLPDTSFAGQQDTYLNIIGETELVQAIANCWSSLWTARAIGYRERNQIPHEEVSMAVVVQEMVPSEVSGVLFTANPLTGRRTETVIDATWGLGEALVSGQVEPDQYIVETASGRITHKQTGAKALAIHGRAGGGVETIQLNGDNRPALTDAQIRELTQLGRQVAEQLGGPQDIEWAIAGGRLYLLQARPVTSLFPLPERAAADHLEIYFSFAAVQGMLDPLTPFGRDTLAFAISSFVRRHLGFPVTLANQRIVLTAAERFWVNISPVARNRLTRHGLPRLLSMVEPEAAAHVTSLVSNGALAGGWPRLHTLWRMHRLFLPLFGRVIVLQMRPQQLGQHWPATAEATLTRFEEEAGQAKTLPLHLAFSEQALASFIPTVLRTYAPLIVTGLASLGLLRRLARHLPDGEQLVLGITRGLEHNVTTEMDLALWQTAQQIAADPAAAHIFTSGSADNLAAAYLAGTLPATSQQALAAFLERYGMRGVAEVDSGRPRWRENPTQIMQIVQSYLQIDNREQAPDRVFARGAAAATAALETLVQQLRQTRLGFMKARLARAAGWRVRAFAGYRESPKFHAVRIMGLVRQELLAAGRQLVDERVLARPDDIFFLHLPELKSLAGGQRQGWLEIVAGRRERYVREQQRQRLPRLLLNDGTTLYEYTMATNGADISGTPVSPGVVVGPVHVVLDPHTAKLAHGDILVCPGTDPAWTPLFLAAGGLITEVGGLMTHGSVVAREYGIPAVVGVPGATTRLKTGQTIHLDGSTGQITLLDNDPDPVTYSLEETT